MEFSRQKIVAHKQRKNVEADTLTNWFQVINYKQLGSRFLARYAATANEAESPIKLCLTKLEAGVVILNFISLIPSKSFPLQKKNTPHSAVICLFKGPLYRSSCETKSAL